MRKNYTFKIYNNRKVASKLSTHKVRRFLNHLRTIKFSKSIEKVYLRISYGKSPGVFGEMSTDYNDGFFENEKDLLQAFAAFNES